MTRRVLLGTGATLIAAAAVVGGAQLTGRLDDLADAVGVEPKPLPDPRDTRILRRAAGETAALLAAVRAAAAAQPTLPLAPVVAVVAQQLEALGGASEPAPGPVPTNAEAALDALRSSFDAAATRRADDAGTAGSPALVRVLAALSAGHAQSARALQATA